MTISDPDHFVPHVFTPGYVCGIARQYPRLAIRKRRTAVARVCKRKWLAIVLLLLASPGESTGSQIKTGTVVIMFFSQQDIIFAADSCDKAINGGKITYLTNDCKVGTLDDKFIYANSGVASIDTDDSRLSSWSGYEVAKKIVAAGSLDRHDPVLSLATHWADRISVILEGFIATGYIPAVPNAGITTGIFGGSTDQGLKLYIVTLLCRCFNPRDHHVGYALYALQPENDGLPRDVAGVPEATAVFGELKAATSQRAIAERRLWSRSSVIKDRDAYVTIRSIKFIIRFAKSPEIALPVSAIRTDLSGKVAWISRCPPTQHH